jgi:Domain of unknown function (DUF397)
VHEPRLVWRKSNYSVNEVNCVQFAKGQDSYAVRDSKNPTGPVLTCSLTQWVAFTTAISRGQFS